VEFRVYPARFHMLAILCILITVNAILWVALAPIITEAAAFYSTSKPLLVILHLSRRSALPPDAPGEGAAPTARCQHLGFEGSALSFGRHGWHQRCGPYIPVPLRARHVPLVLPDREAG
jgi:hypothetical protein